MSRIGHNSTALAAVLMLGISFAGGAAIAADATSGSTTSTPQGDMADKRLKVSEDGFRAERDVGAARIAIFQGNTDAARTLVKDAQTELATVDRQAPKDFPNGAPMADGQGSGNPDVIPIDGQMVVADDMVLTPDKAATVKAANDHLKTGDTAKAMDTLKQGAIDVAFTRILMPVKATTVHVDSAADLLGQGKYYEANLALKAAQDLVRTDTVAFGDTAAQAAKVTGLPAAGSAPAGSGAAGAAAKK